MTNHVEYFQLEELVDPQTFEKFGDDAWWFLDPNAVAMLVALREAFGALTINDWLWGGHFTESGFRHPQSTTGATLSQHKFGRGFDVKSKHFTPVQMQAFILANRERFPLITTMENAKHTETWLHFDTRMRIETSIVIFDLIKE